MSFAPLHLHTYFSLLDGIGKPAKIAKRCASLGYSTVALSDHGNIGAAVEFTEAIRKEGMKPVLGCELYLSKRDPASIPESDPEARKANGRPYSHLVVLARNLAGWKQLVKAVSLSNTREYFHYSPRLGLDTLADFTTGGDLLCFSGHPGSDMGNALFLNPKLAYNCTDPQTLREQHIDPDYEKKLTALAERYISTFGRDNFFLEIQVLNPDTMPACAAIAKTLRWLGKKMGIRCVATADSHYVEREDAYDQRTLLCSKLKTTHNQVARRILNEEDVELGGFFRGDHFHIPSPEEMAVFHRPSEMAMSLEIAAMCDDYDIRSQPRLPAYPCPDGMTPEGYLRQVCEAGFADKLARREGRLDRPLSEYRDRLEDELGVFNGAGLASYFLIVRHGVVYGKSRGWLMGPGRGSAAGCLVSYLADITMIDPLPYDLLRERFYNEGRNSPGRVSLPDIDIDIPVIKRDEVFREYQRLFGEDKVARISTYNTLQGRSALDDVMAAHEIPFDQRKEITQFIPDKARISEELQAMSERGEEPSIVKFSLELYADELSEWARLEDDGTVSGEYGRYFEQAMRLEGTKKNISTHAAGVIISDTPLGDQFPMQWDQAAGANRILFEQQAAEACGAVKLDLLGVAMLNKGEAVRDLAMWGEIRPVA